MNSGDKGNSNSGHQFKGRGWLIAAIIAFIVSLLLVSWFVVNNIKVFEGLEPHTQLLLVIIASISILLSGILVFSIESHYYDPDGKNSDALGLPHGSIAAIISLVILVLFSASSLFLFSEMRRGEDGGGVTSSGITAEMVEMLPDGRVNTIRPDPAPAEGEEQTYTVVVAPDREESNNFARTLLTIFSTLLVAIVGFYFGQGTVHSKLGATKEEQTAEPTDK